MDSLFPGLPEQEPPDVHLKEIYSVNEDIRTLEKCIGIVYVNTLLQYFDICIGIDVSDHFGQNLCLVFTECRVRCSVLSVYVDRLEVVIVGNGKAADAEPRAGQNMQPSDSSRPSHTHP